MLKMFGFVRDASISIQEKLKIGPYSEPKDKLDDKTSYMIHMKKFQNIIYKSFGLK